MSGWSFVHNSLYGIFFVQIVLHSLFLSDHTSFQLTFQSLVSTSRVGRILVYSCQLHFLLPGLFGTVLSFQRSSNLVRVFLYQECCTATGDCNGVRFFNQYRCTSSFPVAFQLGIFLHCIYYHFLADFNFLHTV